jgi:hypothetical protein
MLALALAACLLAGCATDPVVHTDRDPAAAFGGYRSFAWKQEPPISNPLLKQRVVAAIDAELDARGWRRVPEEQADVVLVGNVSARDETSIDAFYDGADWHGWGWRGDILASGLPRRIELRSFKVGTLVIDMFDAGSKRAVWRATAEGTVAASDARREQDAMAAVRKMFAGFPPPDPPAR